MVIDDALEAITRVRYRLYLLETSEGLVAPTQEQAVGLREAVEDLFVQAQRLEARFRIGKGDRDAGGTLPVLAERLAQLAERCRCQLEADADRAVPTLKDFELTRQQFMFVSQMHLYWFVEGSRLKRWLRRRGGKAPADISVSGTLYSNDIRPSAQLVPTEPLERELPPRSSSGP